MFIRGLTAQMLCPEVFITFVLKSFFSGDLLLPFAQWIRFLGLVWFVVCGFLFLFFPSNFYVIKLQCYKSQREMYVRLSSAGLSIASYSTIWQHCSMLPLCNVLTVALLDLPWTTFQTAAPKEEFAYDCLYSARFCPALATILHIAQKRNSNLKMRLPW